MNLRIALFILLLASAAHADVIAVDDRPPVMGATILALKDGQLTYRLSSGREATRPINEIEYVQVSGWSIFNAAEKQQREKQYREAAQNYEKALTDLPASSSLLDRALLARCRLVRAYDADGQFDLAVRVYLDVLDVADGNAYLEILRPKHLPELGSTFLQPARELLDRSIQKHVKDTIGTSLRAWRASWPGADTQPAVENIVRPASRPAITLDIKPDESSSDIRTLVEKGRYRTALERIGELQKQSPQAELFYWQARALLGLKVEDKNEAAINQKRAGLALMRVVIHYPEHAYAPECLYRAAEICLQTGDHAQAAKLWSGLLDRYPTAQPWIDQARQSLQKINRDTATVAGTATEK